MSFSEDFCYMINQMYESEMNDVSNMIVGSQSVLILTKTNKIY